MRTILPAGRWREIFGAGAAIALFLFVGALFVPLIGIQTDEALFADVVYPESCGPAAAGVEVLGIRFPLMLMPYVGTLKGLFYAAWFRWVAVGVWSLRVPMLVLAAAGLALYWLALRRCFADAWRPMAALWLMATEATFVLTSTYDWGPVVLQHLFCAAIVYGLARYLTGGRFAWLLLAALAAGLALWDKAVAVWVLAGFAGAGLLLFGRRLLGWATAARAAALAAALALGALPLIVYNFVEPMATFHSADPAKGTGVVRQLRELGKTFDGSALAGYLSEGRAGGPPALSPGSYLPPHPGRSVFVGALLAAALACAWHRRWPGRWPLFLVTGMALSWVVMIASGGGTFGHHTILLWPAPAVLLAMLLGELRRAQATAVATLVVASNLLVLGGYYKSAREGGPGRGWTVTLGQVIERVRELRPSHVMPLDWGMVHTMCLQNPGPRYLWAPWRPAEEVVAESLAGTKAVYVRSLGRQVFYPEIQRSLLDAIEASGRRLRVDRVVVDARGRPDFQILVPE